ncbi:MAG: hypothetical protein UR26_C0001G0157 [candidate division TM6 bacterium GW2011_GWF2_32_72]|nr:MAG: hypothetical protein UR26_C0001G0157 [candidate division TM6 bacterium GW2011_GWF2_32_72]
MNNKFILTMIVAFSSLILQAVPERSKSAPTRIRPDFIDCMIDFKTEQESVKSSGTSVSSIPINPDVVYDSPPYSKGGCEVIRFLKKRYKDVCLKVDGTLKRLHLASNSSCSHYIDGTFEQVNLVKLCLNDLINLTNQISNQQGKARLEVYNFKDDLYEEGDEKLSFTSEEYNFISHVRNWSQEMLRELHEEIRSFAPHSI